MPVSCFDYNATVSSVSIFAILLRIINSYFNAKSFFTSALTGGLSLESERQEVSLSFQDSYKYSKLNSASVCKALSLPLISNFSSLPFKSLRTVPSGSTKIGINVTVMFHCFFFF